MAVIHQTTVTPSKLELLTGWLPGRQWYRGGTPTLSKAGGFRLDDPAGAVGIEFMLVVDDSAAERVLYEVPLTYRGAPMSGGEAALVGTAEHGVLGRRWIYDATADEVAVRAVVDFLSGKAVAQAQNHSDTADPSVLVARAEPTSFGDEFGVAVDGDTYTDVPIGPTVVRFHRSPAASPSGAAGSVAAPSALGPEVELITVLTGHA
ncbi:1,4-alpha-glucan branching protein [Nocardia sp. NPDC058705]|uniref:maltokinase N-terminal cap-like domain-containing protein n=1 Tax=Nocardia sp. NPDC058705 TaxID=3346609 RepID=UPI0036C68588